MQSKSTECNQFFGPARPIKATVCPWGKVLDSPYSTRLWTFQEALLSSRKIAFLDIWVIEWDSLTQGIQLSATIRSLHWKFMLPGTFSFIHLTMPNNIITRALLNRHCVEPKALLDPGYTDNLPTELTRILKFSSRLECSDPRDRVYSMRWLLKLLGLDLGVPDCTKSVADVFSEAGRALSKAYEDEDSSDAGSWTESAVSSVETIVDQVDEDIISAALSGHFQWLERQAQMELDAFKENVHKVAGAPGGYQTSYPGAQPVASIPSTQSNSTSLPSTFQTTQRRNLNGQDRNSEAEEEDGQRPNKKSRTSEHVDPDMKLACPYYQRNPNGTHLKPSCRGPGWRTVGRLKYVKYISPSSIKRTDLVREHLYRGHFVLRCRRCGDGFSTEANLDSHCQKPVPCGPRPEDDLLNMIEGFGEAQRGQIRLRSTKTWKQIYMILFPMDPEESIPSERSSPNPPPQFSI